jgi:hypothetical protein
MTMNASDNKTPMKTGIRLAIALLALAASSASHGRRRSGS